MIVFYYFKILNLDIFGLCVCVLLDRELPRSKKKQIQDNREDGMVMLEAGRQWTIRGRGPEVKLRTSPYPLPSSAHPYPSLSSSPSPSSCRPAPRSQPAHTAHVLPGNTMEEERGGKIKKWETRFSNPNINSEEKIIFLKPRHHYHSAGWFVEDIWW